MKYILSEEEYVELINKKQYLEGEVVELQNLCMLAAKHIPVPRPWAGEDAKPEPWGCILEDDEDGGYIEYCDDCPCTEVCPQEHKSWSK